MGKTPKKRHHGAASNLKGHERLVAAKERRLKQEQQEKLRKLDKTKSNIQPVRGVCERCGQQQTHWIEPGTAKLLGSRVLACCSQCKGGRLFTIPGRQEPPPRPTKQHIVKACKDTGLRFRIENQYVILTGREVRWYVDCISICKAVFYCGKTRRIWGRNTDYEFFYHQIRRNAVDAILEIGAYDRMTGGVPGQMTESLRASIRRARLEDACGREGFSLSFREPFACIQTSIAKWKFDYHRDKVTLLHKSVKPALDTVTHTVLDYHVQYVEYGLTVEQVVDGIARHDKWREAEEMMKGGQSRNQMALSL